MSAERKKARTPKNLGGITIVADSKHIFLVRQGRGGEVEDVDCFRWPIDTMKARFVADEVAEIHGGLFDMLNRLCNSTTSPHAE